MPAHHARKKREHQKPYTIKGLTLIEMVVVIVVLGVAIPPLLTMWADVAWRSSRAEALGDVSFYAQELMEEIKTKSYDEKSSAPWTNSAGFGAVSDGENAGNKTTFDDVDDFMGATDPAVTTPASGYTRAASVEYARLNSANNTWIGCGANQICQQNVTTCANCDECCYKHIRVSVSYANTTQDVSLDTIISAH